jgi:propionyl-CoA carboxylase beta chain
MGHGAAEIIFKDEIKNAEDRKKRDEKVDEYRKKFSNPYAAAAEDIDDIIQPAETR